MYPISDIHGFISEYPPEMLHFCFGYLFLKNPFEKQKRWKPPIKMEKIR
jgi:hypothetical protein